MNDTQVLQRIIKEEGSCQEWAIVDVHCAVCPLSKLRQADNGSWLGCVEATGTIHMSEEDADKVYKELAESKLIELEIHSTLEE